MFDMSSLQSLFSFPPALAYIMVVVIMAVTDYGSQLDKLLYAVSGDMGPIEHND